MDLEWVKRLVEKEGGAVDSMPREFVEDIIMGGMKIDRIERGRILCSFTVPPRLVNAVNTLHGGATAAMVDLIGSIAIFAMGGPALSVSVEINVSFMGTANAGEEIEIEAKALSVGKGVDVASVEFRSKNTGKIIAEGRHTKYPNLNIPKLSKL